MHRAGRVNLKIPEIFCDRNSLHGHELMKQIKKINNISAENHKHIRLCFNGDSNLVGNLRSETKGSQFESGC